MLRRPRRNRKLASIRHMVQETTLSPSDFIQPYFVARKRSPIESMPGVERLTIDLLVNEAKKASEWGIPAILLFPYVENKSETGGEILNSDGLLPEAIRAVKRALPNLCVIADIALDPYTTHGHDGFVEGEEVLNDETVEILAQACVVMANAGVDMVAPSDMMDGRVRRIRRSLDAAGHQRVSILSYSAKYASAFYGPFREALDSNPRFGDKRGYQMNPANWKEALLECELDEAEGADLLMVKPALSYLDVIARLREQTTLPIAAYHVSGEYAMAVAAGERGWLDTDRVLHEMVLSIKRAGADVVISYAATRLVEQLCGAGR